MLANGSKEVSSSALAANDFHKSNGAPKPVHVNVGPSLTRQEFAEECDINVLMKRYEGHAIGGPGMLPPAQPSFVDFTGIPSNLLDYMNLMTDAESAFMTLPAPVRKEFDNSAHAFVDFASDPENLPQMRTWGLAPPAPAAPLAAPGAPPVVSTAAGGASPSAPLPVSGAV